MAEHKRRTGSQGEIEGRRVEHSKEERVSGIDGGGGGHYSDLGLTFHEAAHQCKLMQTNAHGRLGSARGSGI